MTPSSTAADPLPPLSSTFYWAATNLSGSKRTAVALCASRYRLVILTHGTDPYTLLWGIFWVHSTFPSRLRVGSRKGRLCVLSTIGSLAETTWVSSWTLSSCFPLMALSHSLFSLCDSWPRPRSHSGLWSCPSLIIYECVVLLPSSISDGLGIARSRSISWSYPASTVWSWTESRIFLW